MTGDESTTAMHEPATFELLGVDGAVLCSLPGEPHGAGLQVSIDPDIAAAVCYVRLRNASGAVLDEVALRLG